MFTYLIIVMMLSFMVFVPEGCGGRVGWGCRRGGVGVGGRWGDGGGGSRVLRDGM